MTIYYLCPDLEAPSGGVKQIYRHVDLLNRNDIDAAVLHQRPGFRCRWFENRTRVRYIGQKRKGFTRTFIRRMWARHGQARPLLQPGLTVYDVDSQPRRQFALGYDDIIVLPEYLGRSLVGLAPGLPKVIFNQSFHLTFHGYEGSLSETEYIYHDPDTLAVIAVSDHNKQALEYAFSGLRVYRVRNGINESLFRQARKKKQIAFMPMKRLLDSTAVFHVLQLRGALREWDVVPLDNLSEGEVAQLMGESALFFSFAVQEEGFGLPAAEAAACECILVGYPGRGGEEYFSPDLSFPVSDGGIVEFCQTAERVLSLYDTDRDLLEKKAQTLADRVREKYSLASEERDVLAAWGQILGMPSKKKV